MAVPFRRKSSTRIKKGRGPSNHAFLNNQIQPLVKCNYCSKTKLLHHVCTNCLTYRKMTLTRKKSVKGDDKIKGALEQKK